MTFNKGSLHARHQPKCSKCGISGVSYDNPVRWTSYKPHFTDGNTEIRDEELTQVTQL